jgi:hypothetical protein
VYPNFLAISSLIYCLTLNSKVEHIILTLTKAREYYPPEDTPLELGPTRGCQEAIRCLENHCKLLKGSTSKEVLEVFYQEIGLRLIGCVLPLPTVVEHFLMLLLEGSCKSTSNAKSFH